MERFYKRVNKTPTCWLWIGGKRSRYGLFTIEGDREQSAHRFSWEYFNNKKVPKGMCVLHRCDKGLCVNPKHLFIGTHLDNMRDMVRKGRKNPVYGEKHHRAKLKEWQVKEIRESYIPRVVTRVYLSKKYGVSVSVVYRIVSRKGWKHI